jgi:hypothetical protein
MNEQPNDGQDTTIAVFRKWKAKSEGQAVIALFPCEDAGNGFCESFEHFGQHSGANYDLVMSRTRAATPDEYAALKRELESAPYFYKLVVRKRRPH